MKVILEIDGWRKEAEVIDPHIYTIFVRKDVVPVLLHNENKEIKSRYQWELPVYQLVWKGRELDVVRIYEQ